MSEETHVSGEEGRRSSSLVCEWYPGGAGDRSDLQPARGPRGGDPKGCETGECTGYGDGEDRVGDEASANGFSGWELSETSNSSELPASRDSGEGELEVRGGRKLLRRRRLGKKVCCAVRSTAGRRLAAAQASQAPPLVEGLERGTGDENMDVDEHLALMPLQQAMREAGMRRDL